MATTNSLQNEISQFLQDLENHIGKIKVSAPRPVYSTCGRLIGHWISKTGWKKNKGGRSYFFKSIYTIGFLKLAEKETKVGEDISLNQFIP